MNYENIRKFFKRNRSSVFVIVLIVFILSFWFGSKIMEIFKLIQMKNDLESEIAQKEEINLQLDEEIAQIGSQDYIERIARQYLELYYPNEQIVIPVENTLTSEDVEVVIDTDDSEDEEEYLVDEVKSEVTEEEYYEIPEDE